MADRRLQEVSPWRLRGLTIPPDSPRAWLRLATWEFGMGMLFAILLGFGWQLIAAVPGSIITVFDFTNCYADPPVVQPCERIAYRAGALNAVLNAWCGLMLVGVAASLVWELWSAAAPKPITDDFLKLLDESFGRDWRQPRTWPWARAAWAYGFTLVGITSAVGIGLLIAAALSTSMPARAPAAHIETSQRFRLAP